MKNKLELFNRNLPNIVSLLLLFSLIWIVVNFTISTQMTKQSNNAERPMKTPVIDMTEHGLAKTIKPVALFGKRKLPEKKIEQKREKANLKLELVGTFLGPQPIALVRSPERTKSYGINDELAKGIELLEIHSNYIVLSHVGKEKILEISRDGFVISSSKSKLVKSLAPIATPTGLLNISAN